MAHGLVLRIQDMVEHQRNDRVSIKQGTAYAESNSTASTCEGAAAYAESNSTLSTGEVLGQLWADTVVTPGYSRMGYFTLLRRTLLFVFSSRWSMFVGKGNFICAFNYHHKSFPNITENATEVHKTVIKIFKDPWKNYFFEWDDLYHGILTIYDKQVQDYFESEQEEVVTARIHALVLENSANKAMCLAKTSFLYHSRIVKSFRSSRRRNSTSSFSTSGHASIDWFILILQKTKSHELIEDEVKQIECHEKVEILFRLWRDSKNKSFCYMLLHIFLLQDLIQSSKYCCTKRFFKIFCMMHEELHSSPKEIAESCHKLISRHAPSSAHFYLLVDVLWKKFGMKCLDLYIDLYVRGLTADINNLEHKRHMEASSDVSSLETHIAVIFEKLSTLFKDFNFAAARECMFSAFSLRPTKHKLIVLKELSQILSNSNKNIHKSLLDFGFSTDCNCGLRCVGHCRDSKNKGTFVHPLISCSIGNISFVLKRDFISVLENVRCVTFQYNVFDWQYNIGDLANYLSSSSKPTLEKSESDTESGDEICEIGVKSIKTIFETTNDWKCHFDSSSLKRKIGPVFSNETNLQNIEENVAIQSDNFTAKRVKTARSNMEMSVTVSSKYQEDIQELFNDSLANVIKKSLNSNPPQSWPDSSSLLKGDKDLVINDLNSSKSVRTKNSYQSFLNERNTSNNQRCIESKNKFSSHYSDKTNLQISTSVQYNQHQLSFAVASENNMSLERSSKHQKISHLQKSSAKISDFAEVAHSTSETFSSNVISQKHERFTSEEGTNLHSLSKFDRERPVHNHHLHSSPYVSSQPPPKSFSKHQVKKIHPFAEEKTRIVATLASQEAKESVPCDNTRKSVIVNVKGKSLQIANQLPYSVKHSAIQQNGNNSEKDSAGLSVLHVNVPTNILNKPESTYNGSLILRCKYDDLDSSSVSETSANTNKVDFVSVPGIFAPPSIIPNNPQKTNEQNHVQTLPAKISDDIPSCDLLEVPSGSCKTPFFQTKPGSDLVLKRNVSNNDEIGTPILKPSNNFKKLNQNYLQLTANKRSAYSNTQQLDNPLDSKHKWTLGEVHDSPRSQTSFHPISDTHSAPVSVNNQPWYASPYPKTNSNNPVCFSVHKMNATQTSLNTPLSSVYTMNTSQTSANSSVSFSVQNMNAQTRLNSPSSSLYKMNTPQTSANSPQSHSMHNMNTPQTSLGSTVSFSLNNMNIPPSSLNSPVSSAHKMNTPQINSNSPVPFAVQHMKIPKTNSNSPVSFPVHNLKILDSFGDKVSTYADSNSHNYTSGNVQDKPSVSVLKTRLTSVHNTHSYSHMNAYPYSKTSSYPILNSSHEPSQKQLHLKNSLSERTAHSFITSANITSNPNSSRIQSSSISVYNPAYPANDRRVIVSDTRNTASSAYVQNIKSNVVSQQCCSPFEVNPCDTCTTKSTNQQFFAKTQVTGFRSSPVENLYNQVADGISSEDKCFEASQNMQQQSEEPQIMCTFCSFLFPASLMRMHIENTHQELNEANYNIQNQIVSKETSFSLSEGITHYDSRNENHLSLESIHNACNDVADIENSQNTNQFINSFIEFMGRNLGKSIEGPFENSHSINTNESACDNYKPENFSEIFKGVTRNISSDLNAICDGNELSCGMNEPFDEGNANNIKSLYNALSMDLVNNYNKNEMMNLKISEYEPCSSEIANMDEKNLTTDETDLEHKQTSDNFKNSHEIYKTVEPLEQSDGMHNIQDLNKIGHIGGNKMVHGKEVYELNSSDNASKEACKLLQKSKLNLNPKVSQETQQNKNKDKKKTCTICKKDYAARYFKKHVALKHGNGSNFLKTSDNSSNPSFSGEMAISSSTPEQNQSFHCISTEFELLQEDIDTRTCLSTSDALNFDKFEVSNIRKTSSCDRSNKAVQLGQKYLLNSVPDGVKESSVCNKNLEVLEKPTITVLKGKKTLTSNLGNAFKSKPNRTKRYQCNWYQDQNVCNQGFSAKTRLLGHLKTEHHLNGTCNWLQNNNLCNKNFQSQSLLLKHVKSEHMVKNSLKCGVQQIQKNMSILDVGSQKMKENNLFYNSDNKGSVFLHEDLQDTGVLKSGPHLPSVNLNHEWRKLNNVNSVVQLNSDETVSFSQIEQQHDLPSEQVCCEDVDNHLYNEVPEKNESKCHLSPKSISCVFNISSVDESDILTVEKVPSELSDGSISVSKECESPLNEAELSILLSSSKESMHEINANRVPNQINDSFSLVSDTNKNFQNDIGLVSNSVMNENPSESHDLVANTINFDRSILSTGNSNSSERSYNLIPKLQDFEDANKLSSSRENLMNNGRNQLEKLDYERVCEVIKTEKHDNEVVDGVNSSDPNKLAHYNSSYSLGNQASDKKCVDICHTMLFKGAQIDFRRELPLSNSDPVKQSVLNSKHTSLNQQGVDDDQDHRMHHKRTNLVASDDVCIEDDRKCEKRSKRNMSGELLLNIEKPAVHINDCSRFTDLEVKALSSENSNDLNAHCPISIQDCQLIKNSKASHCTEVIQKHGELNLTEISQVVDKSPNTTFPRNSQFDSIADNFTISNSENLSSNIIELKTNLNFQNSVNVIDEKQSYKHTLATAEGSDSLSNSLPSISAPEEKDMPNLLPEFDFHSLLVNEKFKFDENSQDSEADLKESDSYCFPYKIPGASDISCPTDNVPVSSTGVHIVDNQEPCSYPKVLRCENLSFLNEENSAFCSADTLEDLSINEVGLLGSVMKSKLNGVSTEYFDDSSCNQKEISGIKPDIINTLPEEDSGENFLSSDKECIESFGKSMVSEKSFDSQLPKKKQRLKSSLTLFEDIPIFQGQSSEQEIKETVSDIVSYIGSCGNHSFLDFENYKRNKSVQSSMTPSKTEEKTPSDSSMSLHSNCGENNLEEQELSNKKAAASYDISINQMNSTGAKITENSTVVCRECNQVFQSDEILSDHLQLIHDLPHLKKQISEFRKKSNVDKLSPPPLYFHSVCDYDSASTSAESSPNKCSEDDCCINITSEENSTAESEPSLSELESSVNLEEINSARSIQSSSPPSRFFSKVGCKKRDIVKSRHQRQKRNRKAASVCSCERKIEDFASGKTISNNVVSDTLDKDLICKNAVLPKCIIKVLKDDHNSVFYKIDNPSDTMSEKCTPAESRSVESANCSDTNSNTAIFDHHLESSIKCEQIKRYQQLKRHTKRNCDPCSSNTSSSSILLKRNKYLCKNKTVFVNKKKRTEQKINADLTVKSKDINQFLTDNKQPHVLLHRFDKSKLNYSNISALKRDSSYINFICKKPVVRVKKLKLPGTGANSNLKCFSVLLSELPDFEEKPRKKPPILSSLKKCCVVINRLQ